MKKKAMLIVSIVTLAIGGTIYGFTSGANKNDCPLEGTNECANYQNCPKKGQADCPIIQNCAMKGTPECPYANGKSDCCSKTK